MPQPPLKVDQIQIEPGAVDGPRFIQRASDGSLQFIDPLVPAGLTLTQLTGLKAIAGVLIAGNGPGASFPTIGQCLDNVPDTSSPSHPWVILIMPGNYAETVNIVRDGVTLIGLGGVNILPLVSVPNAPGAYHTVVVQAALGTIPTQVVFRDINFVNIHDNFACVRIVGGLNSTVGLNGILFDNCTFAATAAGGNREIWATAVNDIVVTGGNMGAAGTANLARTVFENVSRVQVERVTDINNLYFTLNPNNDQPQGLGVGVPYGYTVKSCPGLGRLAASSGGAVQGVSFVYTAAIPLTAAVDVTALLHLDSLTLTTNQDGLGAPNLTLYGNSPGGTITAIATNCAFNQVTCDEDTYSNGVNLTAKHCEFFSTPVTSPASNIGGTRLTSGDIPVNFSNQSSLDVTLPYNFKGGNYHVFMTILTPGAGGLPWITGQSASGFTINFSASVSLQMRWLADEAFDE